MVDRDLVTSMARQAVRDLRRPLEYPLVREAGPLLGLYWLYSIVRWVVAQDTPRAAFANAFRVVRLERQLGIFLEPVIQSRLIDGASALVHFANWFYTFGYFPVLIVCAVWLYRTDRARFHTFKLTFLLGLSFALVSFSLFPLAPPRMLPQVGFVDTQQMFGADLYNHKSFVSLYNPYAAMPSLHFGWALLVGIMAFTSRRRALKLAGIFYPLCMAFVIVITGHHYFLDIVGGLVLVSLAFILVNALPSAAKTLAPAGRRVAVASPPLRYTAAAGTLGVSTHGVVERAVYSQCEMLHDAFSAKGRLAR